MSNIFDDLRFAVNNIRSGAAFSNDLDRVAQLTGETRDEVTARREKQDENRRRMTTPKPGGSGGKGSRVVEAAENVTDFQRYSVMPYLSSSTANMWERNRGTSMPTFGDELGNIEASVGRRDGEFHLYITRSDGEKIEVANFDNQTAAAKNAAGIINAMSAEARGGQEDTTTDDTAVDDTAGDDDNLIPSDLGLQPTDDTEESEAATAAANDAWTDVADAAAGTFGEGLEVEGGDGDTDDDQPPGLGEESDDPSLGGGTQQQESTFSDAEIKLEQEDAAAAAAAEADREAIAALNERVASLTTELENATSPEAIAEIFRQASEAAQAALGAEAGQASTAVTGTPGTAAAAVSNPGDALTTVPAAEQTYSSNTAAGGQMEQAAAITKGPSEDAAVGLMDQGVRGTILTNPSGLITDPEDPAFRNRRGLIG